MRRFRRASLYVWVCVFVCVFGKRQCFSNGNRRWMVVFRCTLLRLVELDRDRFILDVLKMCVF